MLFAKRVAFKKQLVFYLKFLGNEFRKLLLLNRSINKKRYLKS